MNNIYECITYVTHVLLIFPSKITPEHTCFVWHPLLCFYPGITGASWTLLTLYTIESLLCVSKS